MLVGVQKTPINALTLYHIFYNSIIIMVSTFVMLSLVWLRQSYNLQCYYFSGSSQLGHTIITYQILRFIVYIGDNIKTFIINPAHRFVM